MYFVYTASAKAAASYTGIAIDPQKRSLEHVSGKCGAYTKSHLPLRIVDTETLASKSSALKREA